MYLHPPIRGRVWEPERLLIMPGRGTPKHNIRVSPESWQAAIDAAKAKDEVLAEEIRWFIETYPDRKPRRKRRKPKT